HQRVKIARGYVLESGSNYPCRHDRPHHCAIRRWASLGASRTTTHVRAEKYDDAPRDMHLAEVNVSLRDRGGIGKARIGKPELEHPRFSVEVKMESGFARREDRPRFPRPQTADFLEPGKPGEKVRCICSGAQQHQRSRSQSPSDYIATHDILPIGVDRPPATNERTANR